MKRAAGVLVNISSFPGEFGIGGFSKDGEYLVSMISKMGFSWLQVLPITAIGEGNSPYSGVSSFAGNSLYINPHRLLAAGLLTADEVRAARYSGSHFLADYDFARANTRQLLKTASGRITEEIREEMSAFLAENDDWLPDYALFMSIAESRGADWRTWEPPLKNRESAALKKAAAELKESIDYYVFEQYLFYKQWQSFKGYAAENGVKILGDIPFYCAAASVDVWANRKQFKLNADGYSDEVAAVPPDYFSETGQLWGNPLYDFAAMEKDGYKWWRRRVSHALKLYDGLRLDHFRAFSEFFSAPKIGGEFVIKEGKWIKGPGLALIELFKTDNPNGVLIAEDLGIIDEKVKKLIKDSELPSMKVLQFAFETFDSEHLPHKYDKNCVVYTATHDNNPTLGWFFEAREDVRNYALSYTGAPLFGWGAGGPSCPSSRAFIRTALSSVADLAVIPVQDLAGYGSDTRMNVPGVARGNWRFRVHYEMLNSIDQNYFLELNNLFGRNMRE